MFLLQKRDFHNSLVSVRSLNSLFQHQLESKFKTITVAKCIQCIHCIYTFSCSTWESIFIVQISYLDVKWLFPICIVLFLCFSIQIWSNKLGGLAHGNEKRIEVAGEWKKWNGWKCKRSEEWMGSAWDYRLEKSCMQNIRVHEGSKNQIGFKGNIRKNNIVDDR